VITPRQRRDGVTSETCAVALREMIVLHGAVSDPEQAITQEGNVVTLCNRDGSRVRWTVEYESPGSMST
jgi:hypothetical protein